MRVAQAVGLAFVLSAIQHAAPLPKHQAKTTMPKPWDSGPMLYEMRELHMEYKQAKTKRHKDVIASIAINELLDFPVNFLYDAEIVSWIEMIKQSTSKPNKTNMGCGR